VENVLLISDGFESILKKVIGIFQGKFPLASPHILIFSNYLPSQEHNITDLEDEAKSLENFQRVLIIHKNLPFLDIIEEIESKKYPLYDRILLSIEGDKQFFWLILCWIFRIARINSRYYLLNPSNSQLEEVGFNQIIRIVFKNLFSRRITNLFLNRVSLRLRLKNVLGNPDQIILEPTNHCNLRCRACINGVGKMRRKKGYMSYENYQQIMRKNGKYIRWLDLSGIGEPLLHKDIIKFIKLAKEHGIPTVQLDTNGNFHLTEQKAEELVGSGLDVITVSLDGITKETYLKNRIGGNIDKVINFVKIIAQTKDRFKSLKPKILVQLIMMRHNVKELERFKQLSAKIGADFFRIKPFWLNYEIDGKELGDILPEEEAYRDYQIINNRAYPKNLQNVIDCRFFWKVMLIAWDGTCFSCCFDPDIQFNMGNILTNNGVRDIWKGERYKKLRRKFLNNPFDIPFCNRCPGG